MMNPLVSILVPIYKVPENYLRKCIESLMSQTLKEIEIILVDDGSPDDCGKICDEYSLRDHRVRVIHKKNGGLAAARNSAFDAATGDYITFLDGDDYLETNACEVAYRAIREHDVEMVFWNLYFDYPNKSEVILTLDENEKSFDKLGCEQLQVRVLDFHGEIAQVFSKLIKRKFLVEHNVRHIEHLSQGAEGFVFNIQLFEHLTSAYYIPDVLLHYTYNEKSITHTPDEKNYYLIIRCFEYIEQYIQNSKNQKDLEAKLLNRVLYVIVTTGITGFFNPYNTIPYAEKKEGYKKFLKEPLVQKSLRYADYEGVSKQRRIILWCVKHGLFRIVSVLGFIRRIQLRNK